MKKTSKIIIWVILIIILLIAVISIFTELDEDFICKYIQGGDWVSSSDEPGLSPAPGKCYFY